MDIKCVLGFLILLKVHVGQGVSKNTIAHLRCCDCAPQRNDCCVGVLIMPTLVLTTAFCTNTCQNVIIGKYKNITMLERYIHQHYKNFLLEDLRHKIQRNDIGLITIADYGNPSAPFLKLSGVVSEAVYGLTALIPVIDNMKPRLVKTVVQRCRKHTRHSLGYVMCAVNKVLRKSNEPCQQVQGVPLLVNGKVIGVTGFLDKTMCENEQKYFLAIGPSLPWIRSVVATIESHRNNQYSNRVAVLRVSEVSPPQEFIRTKDKLPNSTLTFVTIVNKSSISPTSSPSINATTFKASTTLSITNITTTESTSPKKIWSSDENITENEKSTTLNAFNNNYSKPVQNLTNAMDWFNNNVRSKLNTSVPFLVLTTSAVNEGKFADLT